MPTPRTEGKGLPLISSAFAALLAFPCPAWSARTPPIVCQYRNAKILLASTVRDPSTEIGIADAVAEGGAPTLIGFRRVRDRQDLAWYSFAVVHDSTLDWAPGDTLAAVVRVGGREASTTAVISAVVQFAMSPPIEYRPVPLGSGPLRPGDLWRKLYHHDGQATVVFAGFPKVFGLGSWGGSDAWVGLVVKSRSQAKHESRSEGVGP